MAPSPRERRRGRRRGARRSCLLRDGRRQGSRSIWSMYSRGRCGWLAYVESVVWTVVASARIRFKAASRRAVVVIIAWGLVPARSASIARSQVDSARCQQAKSSAHRVSTFAPRVRSGFSPLRQTAGPVGPGNAALRRREFRPAPWWSDRQQPGGAIDHDVADIGHGRGDQTAALHDAGLDAVLNPAGAGARLARPAPAHITPHSPVAGGRALARAGSGMRGIPRAADRTSTIRRTSPRANGRPPRPRTHPPGL